MRIQLKLAAMALGAAAVAVAGAAQAGNLPIYYNTAADLAAAGTIDQLTAFDGYDPTKVTVTPSFSSGLISVAGFAVEVMGATAFNPNLVRNLMTNDGDPPHAIVATLGGQEDLLGLSFGDIGAGGTATLLFTFDDKTGYEVFFQEPLATQPDGTLAFVGIQAPTGRHFTGFTISSDQEGNGGFIGVTDLTLGHTGTRCIDTSIACGGGGGPPDGCRDTSHPCGGGVPEPMPWALMIMGFGGVGAVIRRRNAAIA